MAVYYGYKGAIYTAEELNEEYGKLVEAEKKAVHRRHKDYSVIDIKIDKVFKKLYNQKGVKVTKAVVEQTCAVFRCFSTKYIKLYDGVTEVLDDLIKLPGIGRKTANLVCGDIFGKPAVVVDTHCIRITKRLGLHDLKDQKKIEFALRDLLPPKESNDFCHRLVLHGRAVCTARNAKCESCCMDGFCPKNI
jgi:endonuclease III